MYPKKAGLAQKATKSRYRPDTPNENADRNPIGGCGQLALDNKTGGKLFQAEEIQSIAAQYLAFNGVAERRMLPDQRSDFLLAERERMVGAEHDAVFAHHIDQQAQRLFIEYGGIDIETVHIRRRRIGAVLAHDIAVCPGIFDPSQQKCETAAAMGKTQFKTLGQALKCARQDQR